MKSNKPNQPGPDWLDEFEDLANAQLNDGSACDQVHPLIAAWYEEIMAGDPPESRDAVWQAMQCLTTEVLNNTPPKITDLMALHDVGEELVDWMVELILIGRAFQIALDSGRLDDL